jgi:hypothetical protein
MKTTSLCASALLALALLGCGENTGLSPLPGEEGSLGSTGMTADHDCNVSPASFVAYETEQELQALLVGRWMRCKAPQVKGEDIGVEFTPDHRWYPLTRDGGGAIVRRTGVDYGGEWKYLPPGERNLISGQPDSRGQFVITAITDPPQFTDNPRQLRVLFSPVQSIYVPLR